MRLLYHCDAHRLSAAAVLCSEVWNWPVFERIGPTSSELSDPLWLADLAFLAYLTDHFVGLPYNIKYLEGTPCCDLALHKWNWIELNLNSLNKSQQGKYQLAPQLYMQMKAFCVELSLWDTMTQLQVCALCQCFPKSNVFFQKANLSPKKGKKCLCNHISHDGI